MQNKNLEYTVSESDVTLAIFKDGGYEVGDKLPLKKIKLTNIDIAKNKSLSKDKKVGDFIEVIDFGSEELIDAREKTNGLSTLLKISTQEIIAPKEVSKVAPKEEAPIFKADKTKEEKELELAKLTDVKEQKIDLSHEGQERQEIIAINEKAKLEKNILIAKEDSKKTNVSNTTHGLVFTSKLASLKYKEYTFTIKTHGDISNPTKIKLKKDFDYLLKRGDFRVVPLTKV